MEVKITLGPEFKRQFKRLAKKYHSLRNDIDICISAKTTWTTLIFHLLRVTLVGEGKARISYWVIFSIPSANFE